MSVIYQAKYMDHLGEENTTIHNNGNELRMLVRGIEFIGDDFDALKSNSNSNQKSLTDCVIECSIPVQVLRDSKIIQGSITARIDLRASTNGNILQLALVYDNCTFKSSGKGGGYFEYELWDIQKVLPKDTYIKTCINCELSNIGRYQGMFGALGCYRGNEEEYFRVIRNKEAHKKWQLLEIMTEEVQETHLCSEFILAHSKPGAG